MAFIMLWLSAYLTYVVFRGFALEVAYSAKQRFSWTVKVDTATCKETGAGKTKTVYLEFYVSDPLKQQHSIISDSNLCTEVRGDVSLPQYIGKTAQLYGRHCSLGLVFDGIRFSDRDSIRLVHKYMSF